MIHLRSIVVALFLLPATAASGQHASDLLNQRYSFEISPSPLIEVLGLIRSETGVRFIYSPSSLPGDQLVLVSADGETLENILDELFDPIYVAYEVIAGQIALRWTPPAQRVAFTQTIRGRVLDRDTQTPLAGVNVIVESVEPLRGASTNEAGYFDISGLPLGRHTLQVRYIGFLPTRISEILLTAGKEVVLDIQLVASPIALDQVVVSAETNLSVPLNDAAVVSVRSFSVEETQRFAASFTDPARMAQAFAGVSRSEDDLLNEVIVRGHSPKYTVWRLEGVEIPNPNHFGDDGHSSGGINMLSSHMLTRSEFFTGAFPAGYGNALAGVFDMNLRRGNTEKREHALNVGLLGLEGAVEGPFSGKYDGSYLVNYRYSTLGLITGLSLVESMGKRFRCRWAGIRLAQLHSVDTP